MLVAYLEFIGSFDDKTFNFLRDPRKLPSGHRRRFVRTEAVSSPPLTTDMPGANATGSSAPEAEIAVDTIAFRPPCYARVQSTHECAAIYCETTDDPWRKLA